MVFLEYGINVAWINVLSPCIAITHTLKRFIRNISRRFIACLMTSEMKDKRKVFKVVYYFAGLFFLWHPFFYLSKTDLTLPQTKWWLQTILLYSCLVDIQGYHLCITHRCEFSCSFALPPLGITDLLLGIFANALQLQDSIAFLENLLPSFRSETVRSPQATRSHTGGADLSVPATSAAAGCVLDWQHRQESALKHLINL